MTTETQQTPGERRYDRLHVTLMVILAIVVGGILSVWVLTAIIFPAEFKPVVLSAEESQVLDTKLSRLEPAQGMTNNTAPALQPEAYSEAGANRNIALTEKALNEG